MATTITKTYTVQELSKYGFKANGVYINYSKQLSEAEKGKVVPGLIFSAEVYVADSGKEYLNKILSEAAKAVAAVKVSEVVKAPGAVAPKAVAKKTEEVSKGLSKTEWADKDTRISRQGLIQASLIALAPVVALDVLFAEAKKLAEQGLEFVNGK